MSLTWNRNWQFVQLRVWVPVRTTLRIANYLDDLHVGDDGCAESQVRVLFLSVADILNCCRSITYLATRTWALPATRKRFSSSSCCLVRSTRLCFFNSSGCAGLRSMDTSFAAGNTFKSCPMKKLWRTRQFLTMRAQCWKNKRVKDVCIQTHN